MLLKTIEIESNLIHPNMKVSKLKTDAGFPFSILAMFRFLPFVLKRFSNFPSHNYPLAIWGDARCREIVAAHLPRGTGPKDLEDVHTFSALDFFGPGRVLKNMNLINTPGATNIAMAGKWGTRIGSMYFLLKMGIFQPASC